jgi:hypothetical protein
MNPESLPIKHGLAARRGKGHISQGKFDQQLHKPKPWQLRLSRVIIVGSQGFMFELKQRIQLRNDHNYCAHFRTFEREQCHFSIFHICLDIPNCE